MEILKGKFDAGGNPTITISIYGVDKRSAQVVDAIVDTGFTGFLFLPLAQSLGLDLTPCGTTTVTLADKSTCACLTASGTVILGDEEAAGVVLLEANSTEVLVGMGFLRSFRRALYVSSAAVLLMDEKLFESNLVS